MIRLPKVKVKIDQNLKKMFDELNKKHFGGNLPLPDYLIVSKTMKKRAGCFEVWRKGGLRYFVIKVSGVYWETHGVEHVRDTLLHEMSHFWTYLNHGSHWEGDYRFQHKLKEVGASLFAKPLPRGSFKYTLVCPNCGHEWNMSRLPKHAKACGACCKKYAGGQYDERFRLKVNQNY